MTFWKFPRTEHLGQNSEIVDDDRSMSADAFFGHLVNPALTQQHHGAARLVLQEKVDGANVSVHFEEEYEPIAQKRTGIIGHGEQRQFAVYRDWVSENVDELWNALGTRYVLYGEWLWKQHAIVYDSLPSYFMAFDVLDKESQLFLATPRVVALLEPYGIHTVPLLLNASLSELPEAQRRPDALEKLVSTHIRASNVGSEVAEGVYARIEDDLHVLERAKLRRKTFVSGRQDFHRNEANNSLRS